MDEAPSSSSESADRTSSSAMVCMLLLVTRAEVHTSTGLDYDNLIKDPHFQTNFFPREHLQRPLYI